MTIQVDDNGQPLVAALQFPVYRLSEFDWKNWTPASRFYYTQFIGIDDTATPVVYSLRYCIPGVAGGVGQVSSNTLEDFQAEIADVLARQDRIDLDVADLLAQVNSLLTTAQDVAAQAQSSVTSSAKSATSASDSATKAQTWAEGEDTAVTALGGAHSSKGWADEAEAHATAAHNEYISMTTDANVVAVGSNIGNVNIVATNMSDVNTAVTNLAAIQDAPNQAASANNSKIEAQNSANTAQTMATQASQSASEAAQSAQTAQNSASQAAQSAQTAGDKADEASESARVAVSALSLQIGDVMFAPLGIDESLNLRRYLNGQVLIQSQFVSFTNKVKSAIALYPNLATTEANWQAEKTNSKLGQCGKFVIDDTAGTIRLPAVVNAHGLVDLALIGVTKGESLPNLRGFVGQWKAAVADGVLFQNEQVGAFCNSNNGGADPGWHSKFNANAYSSTYKDNAPVQQEAVQYPYCIVVNTGVEEADRPINNYQVNNVYSYGMSQYYKGTMNNNSWLRSQGQWNDGTVYTGMYNWLLEQMNAGASGFVASTGEYTDYDFVINIADQTFRLPLVAGRVLVAKKEPTDGDYTWYNLYSDGWLEQGGYVYQAGNVEGVTNTTTLPKAFKNNDYAITMSAGVGNSGWQYANGVGLGAGGAGYNERETHMTPTTFTWFNAAGVVGVPIFWEAKGYAEVPTEAEYTEVKGLYYYVGDTLQNADLINVARIEESVVDLSARRYVTEAWKSGTLWYRIWSDGWVEQGGVLTNRTENVTTFNLFIPYNNINFTGTAGVCTAAAMNNGYSGSVYGINSIAPVSGSQACTRTVGWSDTSWAAWGYRS